MKRLLLVLLLLSGFTHGQDASVLVDLRDDADAVKIDMTDLSQAQVNLGFLFPLYDETFDTTWITYTGVLNFQSVVNGGSFCCVGQDMTSAAFQDGVTNNPGGYDKYDYSIFALWTDLDIAYNANPWYKTTDTSATFGWYDIPEFYRNLNDLSSFEIKIFDTGNIKLRYDAIDVDDHAITIGVTGDISAGQYAQFKYKPNGWQKDIPFVWQFNSQTGIFKDQYNNVTTYANGTATIVDPCDIDPMSDPSCAGYYAETIGYEIFGDSPLDFIPDNEVYVADDTIDMGFDGTEDFNSFDGTEDFNNFDGTTTNIEDTFYQETIDYSFADGSGSPDEFGASTESAFDGSTGTVDTFADTGFDDFQEDFSNFEQVFDVPITEDLLVVEKGALPSIDIPVEIISLEETEINVLAENPLGALVAAVEVVSVINLPASIGGPDEYFEEAYLEEVLPKEIIEEELFPEEAELLEEIEDAPIEAIAAASPLEAIADRPTRRRSGRTAKNISIGISQLRKDSATIQNAITSSSVTTSTSGSSSSGSSSSGYSGSSGSSSSGQSSGASGGTDSGQMFGDSGQGFGDIGGGTFVSSSDPAFAMSISETFTEQTNEAQETIESATQVTTIDQNFESQADQALSTGGSITQAITAVQPDFSRFNVAPPSQQEQQTTDRADSQANNMSEEQLEQNLDEFATNMKDTGGFTDQSLTVFLMGRNSNFSQYAGQLQDVSFYTDRGMPGGSIQSDRSSMLRMMGTDNKHEQLIAEQYK